MKVIVQLCSTGWLFKSSPGCPTLRGKNLSSPRCWAVIWDSKSCKRVATFTRGESNSSWGQPMTSWIAKKVGKSYNNGWWLGVPPWLWKLHETSICGHVFLLKCLNFHGSFAMFNLLFRPIWISLRVVDISLKKHFESDFGTCFPPPQKKTLWNPRSSWSHWSHLKSISIITQLDAFHKTIPLRVCSHCDVNIFYAHCI